MTLKFYLWKVIFFPHFTVPVNKREADTDEATNKNVGGKVFACNLESRILVVEVVVGMIGVNIFIIIIQIIIIIVPALEDTDEYDAQEEVCGLEEYGEVDVGG